MLSPFPNCWSSICYDLGVLSVTNLSIKDNWNKLVHRVSKVCSCLHQVHSHNKWSFDNVNVDLFLFCSVVWCVISNPLSLWVNVLCKHSKWVNSVMRLSMMLEHSLNIKGLGYKVFICISCLSQHSDGPLTISQMQKHTKTFATCLKSVLKASCTCLLLLIQAILCSLFCFFILSLQSLGSN